MRVAGERAVQLNHDPADRHEGGDRGRERQCAPAVPEQPAIERQKGGVHRGRIAKASESDAPAPTSQG
jgi:hypothetical protein